jgi:ubiquinone/menaquinone biosynthesis C-methylase UbiE
MMKHDTSWGEVAGWYDRLLEQNAASYQRTVILPNLLRLLNIRRGDVIVDLGCGQGYFSREFYLRGASVCGVDISKELLGLARKHSPPQIAYFNSPAHKLDFLQNCSVDLVTMVFSVQNIENIGDVFKECKRVLRPGGRLVIVMTHPAFRVPQGSSWGWDDKAKIQYRRIDKYLSESKVKIQMCPGRNPQLYTITFHRPLQFYFKLLSKNGFCVRRLEEWISNRKSKPGPRANAENRARREIPLFLAIEAVT